MELRVFVPGELRNQFKGVCATQGLTMSHVITELMQNYVEQQRENKDK
ncbi:MAG: copy number control protein [Nostoc sp. JL34]|nr:copy number control protein [Nostoc sp. JL34]